MKFKCSILLEHRPMHVSTCGRWILRQRGVARTETSGPTRLKGLVIWPFVGKACQPLTWHSQALSPVPGIS